MIQAIKSKGITKLPKGMSLSEAVGKKGDKYLRDKEYDARAMHPGFGAPDCTCHIAPPCNQCIAFTNDGVIV